MAFISGVSPSLLVQIRGDDPPEEGLSWRELAAKITSFAVECLFAAAMALYELSSAACSQIKTWYRQYVCPTSLDKKLTAYENLPMRDVPFLQKAVDILRAQLNTKDRKTFNKELEEEDSEVFIKVATAATRAFVFSNQVEMCKYFNHGYTNGPAIEGVRSREKPPTHITIRENLQGIRELFNKLPDSEKEKLLDLGLSTDSTKSDLSEPGIGVFQEICSVANDLIQGNKPFIEAFQKIR